MQKLRGRPKTGTSSLTNGHPKNLEKFKYKSNNNDKNVKLIKIKLI